MVIILIGIICYLVISNKTSTVKHDSSEIKQSDNQNEDNGTKTYDELKNINLLLKIE